LICSRNVADSGLWDDPAKESSNILFLLIISNRHALAEALLASCSKTAIPGIIAFGTTTKPAITFDINVSCSKRQGGVLGAAAACNQIALVQQLLHLGAEVVPSRKDVCSPLITAVIEDRKDVVELLLQHGADVDAVEDSELSESALIIAAGRRGNYDIASLLLAYGADLNYRNELGTALDSALQWRWIKIAQLLWEAHFPSSEWDRTLLACNSRIEWHWDDTATVHRIDYHTENNGMSDHNPGSGVGSRNGNLECDIWEHSDTSRTSIASAKTI